MTTNEDRTHSKLGGSTANRWLNCPGSVFYLDELPPQETTEAAEEGTKAHAIAEKILGQFLEYKISGEEVSLEKVLKELEEMHTLVKFTDLPDEMVDAANIYRDLVWQNLLEQSITGKSYGLEERFAVSEELQMAGFTDFYAIYIDDKAKRAGIIADFKYGFHPVKAKNNAQLVFYAVAMRKEIKRAGKDIDYIRAAIIQPRTGTPYQEVKLTAKQLDTWEKKFFKAAEQIFVKKKPKFKVGEWCRFCPAKGICTTYHAEMNSTTSLKLIDVDEVKLPVPETMSKEALAKVVLHYDTLKDFIDACYAHVLSTMKQGKEYKGLKLVNGKSRRKWKENEAAIIEDLKNRGIMYPTKEKIKNLTDVEKDLVKLHGKENAQEILSPHIELSVASLSVVADTDPRQKVVSVTEKLETYK